MVSISCYRDRCFFRNFYLNVKLNLHFRKSCQIPVSHLKCILKMESTVSVSKGVFIFNKKKYVKRKKSGSSNDTLYSDPWYLNYKETWKWVETNFEELQHKTFSSVLNDLVSFVKNPYDCILSNDVSTVPTAALLTGINMPDHSGLFSNLTDLLRKEVSPHIAVLHAHKCRTVQLTVEQMTSQLMNSTLDEDVDSDDSDEDRIVKVKKSQSNMLFLQSWYYENYHPSSVNMNESQKRKMDINDEDLCNYDTSPKRGKPINITGTVEQKNESPRKSSRKHSSRMTMDNEETKSVSLKNNGYETDPSCTPSSKSCWKTSEKSNSSNTLLSEVTDTKKENCHTRKMSSRKSLKFLDSVDDDETILERNQNTPNKRTVLNEIVSQEIRRSRRTPKKISRLIEEVEEERESKILIKSGDTPKKQNQLVNEFESPNCKNPHDRWVCELSAVSPSTPLKIPKIVLRQVEDLNCKHSPQKTPLKCDTLKRKNGEEDCFSRNLQERSNEYSKIRSSEQLGSAKKNHHINQSGGGDESKNCMKKLIVVIPEFEKFPSKVLQDFILILRSSVSSLPIVLIMGIATSINAVHRSLPYRMSACLSIKAFQSPPSVVLLNSVLEEILFSSECPFWLSGRIFSFLMDVFLCYDLSVKGFIQSFKFCMMEHFCGQNWKILCCRPESLNEKKKMLTAKDITTLRNLPTFVHYLNTLKSQDEEKKLLSDDLYMKNRALILLKQLHETMNVFHLSLKCLNILVRDLPLAPLGTQVRELYGTGVSSPIYKIPEYQECFKLLGFLSREELISKLEKILVTVEKYKEIPNLISFVEKLSKYKSNIQSACTTATISHSSPSKNLLPEGKINRYAFREKLLENSKKKQYMSPFEIARQDLIEYLSSDAFPELLKPPATMPLAEVLLFDDLFSVRSHLMGAPRAAIHTALTNPQVYLECECCIQTEKDAILSSMPDICIAYKLYRECGRMINLYDWLQAFCAVLKPQSLKNADSDEENVEESKIDPEVHARFTRAVTELQFMGFLKTSGRKVDHVTKLCFDGGL